MNAAFILSRLDSTRLPNKALMKLGQNALIEQCIIQASKSECFEPILLTSDRIIDDPLIDVAKKMSIKYYRGSVDNVYERVCGAIQLYDIQYFVRTNGDSPFIRTELYDECLNILIENDLDFVTNLHPRTFPYGIAIEIFDAKIFCQTSIISKNDSYKEHITSYFYDNIDRYRYMNFYNDDYIKGMETIRLTVDDIQDLEKLNAVFEKYPNIINEPISKIIKYIKK